MQEPLPNGRNAGFTGIFPLNFNFTLCKIFIENLVDIDTKFSMRFLIFLTEQSIISVEK